MAFIGWAGELKSLPAVNKESFLLIFGRLPSIEANSNERKNIQGFDLSFISKPSGRDIYWQAIHYLGPENPSTTYCVFLRPSSWNWYEVARDGELP
jgi:hypothetical protein